MGKDDSNKISEDRLQKIVATAQAYYEQCATQQQIADELNISRSQVSRYLEKAKELGIVSIQITQPNSHSSEMEQRLKELFPVLKDVIVVPFSGVTHASSGVLLGRAVANYLMDVLHDGMSIGIGAGRAVQSVVQWLRPTSQNISVVQAMGSAGYFAQGVDYNLLAHEASNNLGSDLFIINAPIVLWKNAGTVDELLATNERLTQILNKSRNCNVYLIGVGAIENEDLFIKGGLLDEEEIASVREAGAIGNICASFFDENGVDCKPKFENRIMGVRREDMAKAQHSILVATGTAKVRAITGALRGGIVNVLATDSRTAEQIIVLEEGKRNA